MKTIKNYKVSLNNILNTISKNDLKSWQTKTGKPFTCHLYESHIEIHNSKDKTRRISFEKIDELVNQFNQAQSAKVSDYKEISFDASYLLTFIDSYLDGRLFNSTTTYISSLKDKQHRLSRSKIYQQLGAMLKNPNWAWGGVSHNEQYAIFTIWTDAINADKKVELYNPSWVSNSHGLNEQKRLTDIALNNDLSVFGLLCEAIDPSKEVRVFKKVEQNDLVRIELVKEKGVVWALLKERFPMSLLAEKLDLQNLAVDDLDQDDLGSDTPNRSKSEVAFYQRDPEVRKKVLKMADGKCEYCNKEGFLKPDGNRYLETHHIIALSNEGKDKVSNVIALCADHHKEAHFGADSENLEIKFLEIVENR